MLRPWKFSLTEQINARRGAPIYLQLVHALIHEIRRGRLEPGAALPSTREMANALGFNRKTVVLAYDDLIAQGWFSTRGTRGTFVSEHLPEPLPAKVKGRGDIRDYAAPEFPFHQIPDPMLVFRGGDTLTIDDGLPDQRLFPAETLALAHRAAGERAARGSDLGYGDPRGSEELRRLIAEMLTTHRGLLVDPENICITRGSQMGIFLASRILLSCGDAALVEGLSYSAARHSLAATGAEVIGVKLDADGIDVDQLEQLCRKKNVRAVYVTPHHQFPTTVSLCPERRIRLSNLAAHYRFAIIEDDYDHEFHFERQPLLPIASHAPNRTIYIGSMSKLLLPALRIGFVAASKSIIKSIANLAAGIDRQGNALTELAVADLIRSGELRRHVRKARKIYMDRRDAFGALLREKFAESIKFNVPDGGLAYWATFRRPSMLESIEANAADCGVRFLPSNAFAAHPQQSRGLRLGFASLNRDEAREAVERLHAAAVPHS